MVWTVPSIWRRLADSRFSTGPGEAQLDMESAKHIIIKIFESFIGNSLLFVQRTTVI
jgi:hypothetical protein